MKKVLSIMLAALMMLSAFGVMAYAVQNTDITIISIQNVVAPVDGANPSYTYTNNADYYHFCDEYEGDNGGAVKNCMEWFDVTDQKSVLPTDTFQAGHVYTANFYLIADDGYIFPEIVDQISVNGIVSDGIFLNGEIGHSYRYYVSVTFPSLTETIKSIAVTGVTAPANGAKPAYSSTVASSEGYTVTSAYDEGNIKNGVEWFDVTGNKSVKSTDTFQEGHSYSVTVYLRAKEDYAFQRVFNGTATLNGKSAQAQPADPEALVDFLQDYTVSYTFPVISGATPVNFPDVTESAWYYEAAQYCAQRDWITGYKSNGKFGGGDPLQRQDFVVILARIAQADTAFYTYCKLKDVDMKAYYGPAVAWAEDNDIVNGYSSGAKAGNFGVGDKITREQVATILYRFMGAPAAGSGNIMNGFADRTKVSDFADEAMIWAVNKGIISGKNGKLAPQDNASRAEIATMIMRMDKAGMF